MGGEVGEGARGWGHKGGFINGGEGHRRETLVGDSTVVGDSTGAV